MFRLFPYLSACLFAFFNIWIHETIHRTTSKYLCLASKTDLELHKNSTCAYVEKKIKGETNISFSSL